MSVDEEPAFDPKTWTPVKPWPKGYHKPRLGVIVAAERMNRAGGNDSGVRFLLWAPLTALSQWIGLAAARPTPLQPFGMVAIAIQRVAGAWPLPILFIAVLPALLYAVIVPGPGVRFRRAFAYGLGWSLVLRIVLMILAALLLPRHPPV